MSISSRIATLAAAFAVAAATGLPAAGGLPSAYGKTCSAGYVHGVINGAQKCLRHGEYCTRSADRQYHRYGFHCHRSGRLT